MDIKKHYESFNFREKLELKSLIDKDIQLKSGIKTYDWAYNMEHNKDISRRLYNIICSNDIIRNTPLHLVQEEDIIRLRNSGTKCWEEFKTLRDSYFSL
jgi:hypothetical protein